MVSDRRNILSEASLSAYFHRRLMRFSRLLDPAPHADTVWYLGHMLERLGDSRAVFSYHEGHLSLRPLALLYSDAREASNNRERCLILRQLGDLALFIGALFPESYRRKGLRQDYFIGMGGGAYDYLSENAPSNHHIFAELSTAFASMLQLVKDCCSQKDNIGASDIVKLYERWLATGNPAVERQLKALGVVNLESLVTATPQ
jgi:hypothetical protein